MIILSIILAELVSNTFGQNIPNVCSMVSPNNRPETVAAGCVNGTTNFFLTEFPDEFDHIDCLCCTPGTDDNPPDNCVFNQTLESFEGRIICSENFDCCECGAIICTDCVEVNCGGDESCLGVDDIRIDGSTTSFAVVNCNGDISCFRTIITGERVSQINCNGDRGCGNSTFTINKQTDSNALVGFKGVGLSFSGDSSAINSVIDASFVSGLECAGDDSCPDSRFMFDCTDIGCPLTVNGDRAAINAIWDITNAAGLDANGDDSVANTTFNIDFIPAGGAIAVTGDRAALDSVWNIKNGNGLNANGDDSVAKTTFNIEMISSGGALIISGDDAAFRSMWDVTNAKSLLCGGDGGCKETNFTIQFIPDFKDARVSVTGPNGATDSIWELTNPASISCGALNACQRISLTATCAGENIAPAGCGVSCIGINSCEDSTLTVTNVNALTCTQTNACSNSNMDITCLTSGCPISCNSGCKDSTFNIQNPSGLKCFGQINILNAQGTVIAVEGTCENSIFNLDNNRGGTISCTGPMACAKASITDPTDSSVPNLASVVETIRPDGIGCRGEKSCFDALILGECSDGALGCSLTCEGADSCSAESTKIIQLNKAKDVKCIGGSILGEAIPACGNRIFVIGASSNPNFGVSCSGSNSCIGGIFNINGDFVPNSIIVKDIKCDSTSACVNAEFNFGKSAILSGKFGCNAVNACNGAKLSIDIQDINDQITVNSFECTTVDACANVELIFTLDGVLLTDGQIESKKTDGTFILNVLCSLAAFCPNTKINGVVTPFYQPLNSIFGDVKNPTLVNSLGIMWMSIVGVLVIIIIILVRKNYQYRNIEKNMAVSLKTVKSNKNDRRNSKHRSSNISDQQTEIKYADDSNDHL